MEWYWILIIVVVVIFILWWALRRNAKATEVPQPHHEEEKSANEETPVIQPTKEADIALPDDLEMIEGIGPKIASVLKEAGITTFVQLAEEDPAHLKDLLEKVGLRLGDPTTWPDQARLAAAGDQEGLKRLQDQLKGGKVVK